MIVCLHCHEPVISRIVFLRALLSSEKIMATVVKILKKLTESD